MSSTSLSGAEAYAVVADSEADTPFVAGNTAKLLVNGEQFFPAMLSEIRAAQTSVTLESYIWCPGRVSDAFIAALCERARAGVKVHVLVDGMGTLKFKRADRERLEEAGVEYHRYHRKRWWHVKVNINHRTHRKLLIVDGRVGFTGGMCIDDAWDGGGDRPERWRETVVRLTGPVVAQMQAAFAVNWDKTTGVRLLGPAYFPPLAATGTVRAKCAIGGPGEGPRRVEEDYVTLIVGAQRTIDIGNAYFIPDDRLIEVLLEARARGVRVRVVAPAINDSKFGRAASRSRWGRLLAAGVEIYLFGAAMYHAKTMAVDEDRVMVGSANFDHRSFRLNDEVVATCLDPALAAEHGRMFTRDLAQSRRVTWEEFRARPWFIKLADHVAGMFRWFL